MKIKIKDLILIFTVFLYSCSTDENDKIQIDGEKYWTTEKSYQHFLNRQDSSKWDYDLLIEDLKNIDSKSYTPLLSGTFPIPKYDLVSEGSFSGLGNYWRPGGEGYEHKIDDKTILYNSFFVKKSKMNKEILGDKKNEIFFQIIVLTDFVDTVNLEHLSSEITSRNHPDYIGQGHFNLNNNNRIDYIAFLTANRNSYAIINMRLFDLQLGQTILIAPQRDKSFRSMQILSPLISSEDIEKYTKELLSREDIIDFFTRAGNI